MKDVAGAEKYIARAATTMIEEHGFGLHAMVLKQCGTAIGICGLVQRDGLPGPDLGFALLSGYQRRGYTREAAVAILEHSRDALEISRLLAITSPTNEPAAALLGKLGFRFETSIDLGGAGVASDLYAIELSELPTAELRGD